MELVETHRVSVKKHKTCYPNNLALAPQQYPGKSTLLCEQTFRSPGLCVTNTQSGTALVPSHLAKRSLPPSRPSPSNISSVKLLLLHQPNITVLPLRDLMSAARISPSGLVLGNHGPSDRMRLKQTQVFGFCPLCWNCSPEEDTVLLPNTAVAKQVFALHSITIISNTIHYWGISL